jgi:MoxR-like ATPase
MTTSSFKINSSEAQEASTDLATTAAEIGKAIVGQGTLVEAILLALVSDGHILIEGVPGLAKTKTVKTLAEAVGGSWSRIQFTPDLVPSDLIGTRLWRPDHGEFVTELGPVVANFVLADEINRAPAKVQSALLEAMEERQITIGGTSYSLPKPYLVLATMNPIENEGTYALPEAQTDRFLFKVTVGYPEIGEELEIVRRSIAGTEALRRVLDENRLLQLQDLRSRVYVGKDEAAYAVALAAATRDLGSVDLGNLSPYVTLGAGVRASLAIVRSSQSRALLCGRRRVSVADIIAVAPLVLTHRINMSYRADSESVTASHIVDAVIRAVKTPRSAR